MAQSKNQTERTRLYRQRKRERGLCWQCTKPATDGTLCAEHAQRRRERVAGKVAEGLCARCRTAAIEYGSLCIPCLEYMLEYRAVKMSQAYPLRTRPVKVCSRCGRRGHTKKHCDILSEGTVNTLEWLATR